MRILSVLTVAALNALAGTADVDAQTIGFKLGASFSNLDANELESDSDLNTLTSFTGGGFIRFGTGRIRFQPELMYITKGTTAEADGEEGKLKLAYVEVPVLLVLSLTAGGSASPYLIAGPAIALETGCELSGSEGGVRITIDCDDLGFETKSLDVGLLGGIGVEFAAGPGSVVLEGRYNLGMLDINDGPGESVKNRSGQVLVGYSIPLTR